MKAKVAWVWAIAGMMASSAAALAVPVGGSKTTTWSSPNVLVPAGSDKDATSRFEAGRALTIDARLGHASVPQGGAGETFLFASVAGGDVPGTTAAPMNLALVMDRSGSMRGPRIANAIDAAAGIVERMRDGDSVTVVSFDDSAHVLVPPTLASASSRPFIESAIRSIGVGGDTCMSCGLEAARRELDRASLGSDRVDRMILLSDGAANRGVADPSGLRAMASRMRDRCSITTIGVDVDFDEKVMAAIAQESNGRHYFVASSADLAQVFDREFDSILSTVARDAELSIDLAPGVEVEEVFDRAFRRESGKIVVPFGTFGTKQEKTVLMRLRVPVDKDGAEPIASMSLRYRDLAARQDTQIDGKLALLVTNPDEAQRDLDPFVAARLERSRTARTLTEANDLFEQGRVTEAHERLAAQELSLHAGAGSARAAAKSLAAPKPTAAPSLDRDFEAQLDAITSAEQNFAQAPSGFASGAGGGSLGGPSPFSNAPAAAAPQDTRAGKKAVRENQSRASDLAF